VFRYSKEVQEGQLFSTGFARDDHKSMEAVTNSGFTTRKAWTAVGAVKEFFGKLDIALFKQNRLLVPGVDLHLKLERAKDAFCIFNNVASLRPKVVIDQATLEMLAVKVNPQVMQQHMQALLKGAPALYPINRIEIDNIVIKENTIGEVKDFLFYGHIPKYIIMTMVSNSALNGHYTKNPFNFKHYNLKYVRLTKDKEPIPFEAFEPDFKTNNCLREYMSLFQSNGLLGKNCVLPINFDEFKNGYTNFQWNLSENRNGANSNSSPRGNLQLELKFSEPLTEAVNVILYGILDSTVMVSGDMEVATDYNA
jgi:hypothetical protein